MFRKFFCFARRSGAEAGGNAGRDYSKFACGFCPKKVRILTKRRRQLLISLFSLNQTKKLHPFTYLLKKVWLNIEPDSAT